MAEYIDKSKITEATPAEEDNIELVIKLPKEIYVASRMLNVKPDDVVQIPLEVITNGIPLPKGHGALIDKSELPIDIFYDDISEATVIIPSDKESEEYCETINAYLCDDLCDVDFNDAKLRRHIVERRM